MKKTTLAFALCALGAIAGQPVLAQVSAYPGYLNSSSGIVKSGTGLCWHTGSWSSSHAVDGCDLVSAEKSAIMPVAELLTTDSSPSPAFPSESIELDALVHFAFDSAVLTSKGHTVLNNLAAQALSDGYVSMAIVTGHADRFGSQAYNHNLALSRASAVAEHLVSRGIPATVQSVTEKGESQPVVDCTGSATRATIMCLAPNRRVEVVISIVRNPNN